MRAKKAFLTAAMIGLVANMSSNLKAEDIDAMPPVVVQTVPVSGIKEVQPGVVEIKVKFSKEMKDGSWSWSSAWKDSTPEMIEKPWYEADHRTCVLKVKLDPDKTYGYWLNSQKFTNFRDTGDHAAVPYLLTFRTTGASK